MSTSRGGTALDAIRTLFEADGPAPTALTQTFLFMAARQQHVTQVIRPALTRGAVVLSDRYVDATMAYQGFGQGVDLETIRDLNALATGGVMPDLTLLLDLDPAAGMARIGSRRDASRHGVASKSGSRGVLEIARNKKRGSWASMPGRSPRARGRTRRRGDARRRGEPWGLTLRGDTWTGEAVEVLRRERGGRVATRMSS